MLGKNTYVAQKIHLFERFFVVFLKKQKQCLKNKELTITHYTHATAEINCGNFKIITKRHEHKVFRHPDFLHYTT